MSEALNTTNDQANLPKKKRGFAAMDPERRKEIAGRGGKSAHQQGKAHRFTREEAQVAGSKGGKAVSRDREHMSKIGRKGGKSRKTTGESTQGEA